VKKVSPKKVEVPETEMKDEEVDSETFEKKLSEGRARGGSWKQFIQKIRDTGKPYQRTGLRRTQVAAGYRACKEAGLRIKTDYKNGVIIAGP
jgi:hypothetical protein